MFDSPNHDFVTVDVGAIPVRPEIDLATLFGVRVVQQRRDFALTLVTVTTPALDYLCHFSSDRNADLHAKTGLVQGSLWMWMVQLVVLRWIPEHGPQEFSGCFPNPSFSSPDEQLGFELAISVVERRELQCVVRGPFRGEQPPAVFEFNCKIFPMKLAVRSRRR